jgi:hypothetical protein
VEIGHEIVEILVLRREDLKRLGQGVVEELVLDAAGEWREFVRTVSEYGPAFVFTRRVRLQLTRFESAHLGERRSGRHFAEVTLLREGTSGE